MRIDCPFCGTRDVAEFSYLGDAALAQRPQAPLTPVDAETASAWHDYVYLRDNPASAHTELWYHAFGCRQWLTVTRNLRTHEISHVEPSRAPRQRGVA